MLANDWHRMTQGQWAAMAGCIVGAVFIALFIEWLGRPRLNKWQDWKRRR